jgi:hypothetical protein
MNRRIIALVFVLRIAGETEVLPQTSFQNLDFESAHLPLLSPETRGFLTNTTEAVPSWSVFYDAQAVSQVGYHAQSLGSTVLTVWDANMSPPLGAISGNFSVVLAASSAGPPISLIQSGTIPSSCQSFRFKTGGIIRDGWLQVYFQNELLPLQQLAALPNNIYLYGADISKFQSQYGELKLFGAAPTPFSGVGGVFDDLEFSPTPVPEPATVILLALGGVFTFAFRRRVDVITIWPRRDLKRESRSPE